jgi:hypothetical protein
MKRQACFDSDERRLRGMRGFILSAREKAEKKKRKRQKQSVLALGESEEREPAVGGEIESPRAREGQRALSRSTSYAPPIPISSTSR